jgi:DNA polymerase-3 subunit alpha
MEADQLKLLGRAVTPIDTVAAQAGAMGLRVFVEEAGAVDLVAALLDRAAKEAVSRTSGPVQLCLMAPDLPGEVEIALGDAFPVNPQIKGAIKSLDGVLTVEDI